MKLHDFYRIADGTIARAEVHGYTGGHWSARLWDAKDGRCIGWVRTSLLEPSLGYSDEAHPAAAESIAAASLNFWRTYAVYEDGFHLFDWDGSPAVSFLSESEIEHRTPTQIEAAGLDAMRVDQAVDDVCVARGHEPPLTVSDTIDPEPDVVAQSPDSAIGCDHTDAHGATFLDGICMLCGQLEPRNVVVPTFATEDELPDELAAAGQKFSQVREREIASIPVEIEDILPAKEAK